MHAAYTLHTQHVIFKKNMEKFHHVYTETIAISRADKARLRELNTKHGFEHCSLAGTLAAVIATYNFKKHGIEDNQVRKGLLPRAKA